MVEAVGVYSELIQGLKVMISPSKVVEIKFLSVPNNITDGSRYHITGSFQIDYVKNKEAQFRVKVQSITAASEKQSDYAIYQGVIHVNEGAGGFKEKNKVELYFYRGDALSDDLFEVTIEKELDKGWITVAIPNIVSSYSYRAGDLLYIDGRIFHKYRDIEGVQTYELCVRAERCYKIDGTEYWEKVRAAHYRASKKGLM